MSLIRWTRVPRLARPTVMMQDLLDEVDRLRAIPWADENDYGPPVDIYQTEDEVVVKAQLPGVSKDEVEVSVQDDTLTIRAEAKREEEVDEDGCFRREIQYGTCVRTVPLPANVDEEQVTATLTDGLLEVHAKKADKPEEGGRKVEIE